MVGRLVSHKPTPDDLAVEARACLADPAMRDPLRTVAALQLIGADEVVTRWICGAVETILGRHELDDAAIGEAAAAVHREAVEALGRALTSLAGTSRAHEGVFVYDDRRANETAPAVPAAKAVSRARVRPSAGGWSPGDRQPFDTLAEASIDVGILDEATRPFKGCDDSTRPSSGPERRERGR